MAIPNVRELIRAGFHFGHRTSRWNPKMAPYIFKRRNLIHIIDLRETLRGLITSSKVAAAVAARGQYVLFVGTKKQAREATQREAQRCGMPYVSERWPGGLLTNYATVRRRLERLEELEQLERTGEIRLHSKKMISSLRRETRKILRNLGGVRRMQRLPGLLAVVDPAEEHLAVREAGKLNIPIVALTDTDGDPDSLDVVVPGNDDSIGAIEIFLRAVSDGSVEGQKLAGESMMRQPEAAQPAAAGEPEAAPEAAAPAVAAEADSPSEPVEAVGREGSPEQVAGEGLA